MSSSASVSREKPEEKRLRKQNEQLETAVRESLETQRKENERYKFSDFSGFLNCLNSTDIPSTWTVLKTDVKVLFLEIETEGPPTVTYSVIVDDSLRVTAFSGPTELSSIGDQKLPIIIEDIRTLEKVLQLMRTERKNITTSISIIMQEIEKLEMEDFENGKSFLSEQIRLFSCPKTQKRYSSHTMIFFTLLYTISPHGYNFLRKSGYVVMPHPSTLRKVCSGMNFSPQHEQLDENFLSYAKDKFKTLEDHEKMVSLMIDEMHLKSYFDYKGGNIVGMSYDGKEPAASAHTFMVQSFLSSYKDVVHILPVRKIDAEKLHEVLKKVIIGLEKIGYMVICVVSDNNSINRKAMSFFANPSKISIVYPHPFDSDRPLFFVIDSVHILKCIRNNWINQKNNDKCMFYPDFDNCYNIDNKCMKYASFNTLKHLYDLEKSSIVRYENKLTLKSLSPSNLERQNVQLVLQVFNEYVVNALLILGPKNNLKYSLETAKYIELIYQWWCIMNVKCPQKGKRLKNTFMYPLTNSPDDTNMQFLYKFIDWMNEWKDVSVTSDGVLTKETHFALTHTTYALTEMTKYCIDELKMKYFMCGKVQTDSLEERFGKYRYLAGCQYNVSIRQVFECETKLRIQNSLHLTMNSSVFGNIDVKNFNYEQNWEEFKSLYQDCFTVNIIDKDLDAEKSTIPIITFLAGYCIHSVYKHFKCNACFNELSIDKELICDDEVYKLINGLDRGGLKYPKEETILVVLYCYVVVKKLLSKELEGNFLKSQNQRLLVTSVTYDILNNAEIFNAYDVCSSGHCFEMIVKHVLWVASNIFLKNYCMKMNDRPVCKVSKKRKLETLVKPKISNALKP